MTSEKIIIRGARQHNLKNIDVELPRNRLVTVTGLSGSGKSTLAFDTLYAEGQRRYVESLSTYARQFLERMEKPDVDVIEGLSPAIAIEQKTASQNPRSTVGTVTEIYDYLRLLYARIGIPHCHRCGQPVTARSLDQITERLMALPEKTRMIILAPLAGDPQGDDHGKRLRKLRRDGFSRIRVDGEMIDIESARPRGKGTQTIELVVDRLIMKPGIRNRLADSLELALGQSGGRVTVDVPGGEPIRFSEKAACLSCGIRYPEFTPASFSFNSPRGACPRCDGLGSATEFAPGLIVPNPDLSLREGAVAPWAGRNSVHFTEFTEALTRHYGADIHTPYNALPEALQQAILYGSGHEEITFYFEKNGRRIANARPFEGVIPKLQRLYAETGSPQSREEIRQYMTFRPCPACDGTRLSLPSRFVRVGNRTLPQLTALSVACAHRFLRDLNATLRGKAQVIGSRILKEIAERLGFLENVGLSYLTLDRSACTLSGGESQRIRLATQIGSKLTGVLYVLDEPSIGLHQRDNRQLLSALLRMRDLGNTVLVVEHDEETIRTSDYVIDMGPGAGARGGEVVFSGPPDAMMRDEHSLTGQYLSGRKSIAIPDSRRPGNGNTVTITGATGNNLRSVDAVFPLGCLICVTGVSGSGKSTLVLETLGRVMARQLFRTRIQAAPCSGVSGLKHVDKVINIDQSPVGRTPRSNPGTYTGIFTHIRELFAKTPEARMRGYKTGRFSFNVRGGRCEACRGDGVIRIEMHFLPDVYVTCDVCQGRRYNRETLEIRYKGKNIAEVLDMTVNQSLRFFENISAIRSKLETLSDVGLGYLRIGQPATTLSGGEAQRVRLAKELSKRATGQTVYILDEPTTGLHMDDIQKLLDVLNRLVDRGNTVIVIEHNMDVIKSADHIIDLGPEGGEGGGRIIAQGTPEAVARAEASFTGRFLKPLLHGGHGPA
ncbi:excinuclease ABC subunit A [Desulfonema ishimotonii]|uniref:UvrABC system protein A n=1 Tax=Desulfonema ishimotonii TaxID=45657 RepID=A0A401G4J0_9BACT|nr:excinuclease ABC subunit UvrA [Desulfonema ishimotonii]GBC64157.1 excinuclease ABC subunit A [Desulfonema ishimotonii]